MTFSKPSYRGDTLMSTTYTVNPASGDSSATIYSSSSMTSSNELSTLSKGTVVSVKQEGSNYYQIAWTPSSNTNVTSVTVKTNSGLNCRTGPGTSYTKVGTFKNGTKLTVSDYQNGWYKVSGTTISNGYKTGVWVYGQYVTTTGTTNVAYIAKTDVKINSSTTSSSSSDYDYSYIEESIRKEMELARSVDTNYSSSYSSSSEDRYSYTDSYYKEDLMKYNYCFGAPPKYNMDIDIQYVSDVGLGRVVSNTFYSNPAVLSICPGKVKMFPHLFNSSKRDSAFNAIYNAARGDDSVIQKIMGDKDNDLFNGSLYEFSQDTEDYAKRVNLLCRASAVLLGIGDEKMPYTSTKLKNFDYTYWSIRKKYSPQTGKDQSLFKDFWSGGIEALSSGMTDSNYIHFLVNNENSSVSESISTNTESSFLDTLFSTSNTVASQLSYFTGIGFNDQMDVSEKVQDILNGVIGENGWTKLVDNTLSGGKLKIPKIVGDTDFSQNISMELNFMSPYGSPKAVFLWCIVPVCHLCALALPKQLSDSMFSYPYILKVFQKGWFNSNLAVITDFQITRGGQDNTSWTVSGLATEWKVNLSITPLYSNLTMPSTDHPLLFIRNDGIIDFLGNMCGFDLKGINLNVKADLMSSFVKNRFTGILNDTQRWVSDSVSGVLDKVFHMG